MKLVTVTKPTDTPVTLLEAKEHMRVLESDDDAYIQSLIDTATALAEQITNRQLVSATYRVYFDSFQDDITLPRPPLKSVNEVGYIDTNGIQSTTTAFRVDSYQEPAVLHIEEKLSLKSVENSLWVEYVCGYDKVPEPIKQWIKIKVATMYEQRESLVPGISITPTPKDFTDSLLDSYRIIPL
jgi:uncharacterized phiE125 gp8 family phage protein